VDIFFSVFAILHTCYLTCKGIKLKVREMLEKLGGEKKYSPTKLKRKIMHV
jgi:hypothetical protein